MLTRPLVYMLLLLGFISHLVGESHQSYIKADPFYLLDYERQMFTNSETLTDYNFRPHLPTDYQDQPKFQLSFRTWNYYNDNAPNLENTGEIWVGKGGTTFSSLHASIISKYFLFSIEPYFTASQNKDFENYHVVRNRSVSDEIVRKYYVLNDGPGRGQGAFHRYGIREFQAYVHYEGLAAGLGNNAMWWGPGVHTNLSMTNNTTGFPYFMLGTLRPVRYRNLGIQARYVFSKLDKNANEPYFTAVMGELIYYSEPTISLGVTRTFLSGGSGSDESVSWVDAALLPFESFLKEKLAEQTGLAEPGDDKDQTVSLFLSMLFDNGLKLFLEYGWNDHRWDWYDLRAHPDHSGASVIGFRKYGLFNHQELMFGFEYAKLVKTPFYPLRGTPDWYGRPLFDYSTYDGRRFAAHSGSDSDDMYLYVGYVKPDWSILAAFNYERHGVVYSVQLLEDTNSHQFPETKLELRLDYRHNFKFGRIYVYYEYDFAENLGSPAQLVSPHVDTPVRKGNVYGLGFETDLSSKFKAIWDN